MQRMRCHRRCDCAASADDDDVVAAGQPLLLQHDSCPLGVICAEIFPLFHCYAQPPVFDRFLLPVCVFFAAAAAFVACAVVASSSLLLLCVVYAAAVVVVVVAAAALLRIGFLFNFCKMCQLCQLFPLGN